MTKSSECGILIGSPERAAGRKQKELRKRAEKKFLTKGSGCDILIKSLVRATRYDSEFAEDERKKFLTKRTECGTMKNRCNSGVHLVN